MQNARKQTILFYIYSIKCYTQKTSEGGSMMYHHVHCLRHCPTQCMGGSSWGVPGDANPSDTIGLNTTRNKSINNFVR